MADKFGFFKFYYYIITRNEKRYRYALDNSASIPMTPIILFVLHMALSLALSSEVLLLSSAIHIPVVIGNLLVQNYYSNKYFSIRRQQREAEFERMRKERWREYIRWHEEQRREEGQWGHSYYDGGQYYYRRTERQKPVMNNSLRNAMTVLGLREGFTKKDARYAYRQLSKRHHPDLGGSQEKFIEINKAYKYITDNI